MENLIIERYAETNLPTQHGVLRMIVFRNNQNDSEDIAMINGNIEGAHNVPVRVHSECLTSEVFGSLKCDCRDQLHFALDYIAQQKNGIVLYLRQEGRGIGLGNKIRAYSLQELGFDTVDANRHLGYDDDLRDYSIAVKMLEDLGVKSVRLLTNNPKKINGLTQGGIKVVDRQPIQMKATSYSEDYLITKANRSGHMIDVDKIMLEKKQLA